MPDPQKPFDWSNRTLSPSGGKPPEEEGWKRHLRSPVVLAGAVGAVLVVAGGLFSLTAVGVAGSEGGGGAIGELPGAGDRRAFKVTGRQLFAGRRDDARQDRMNLEAIAAAEKRPGGGGLDGVIPEEAEDEMPPPLPKGGTGAPGGAGGSSAKAGGGVAAGGAAGEKGKGSSASFPQLAPTVNMQGMRNVSSNSGLRGLSSGRAMLRRIGGRGTASDGSGSGGVQAFGTGSGGGGAAGSGAGGAGGGGGAGSGYGAASEGEGGASQNPGGGGGGGGGGAPEIGDLPETPQQKIERLMQEAGDLERKADKEKRYAQQQQAGGNGPAATYHYNRYKDFKARSRQKSDEATRAIAEVQSGVDSATSEVRAGSGSAGEPGSGQVQP